MLRVDDERLPVSSAIRSPTSVDGPDGAGVEQAGGVVDDLLGRRFRRGWRIGGAEGGGDRDEPRSDERDEPEREDCVA